jgi:glycosyl transferase family 1
MSVLVLVPQTAEAKFSDLDYAQSLGRFGFEAVHRVDPEVLYQEGGISRLEDGILRIIGEHDVEVIFYALGTEFDFRPQFFYDRLAHLYRVLILGDDEHYFDISHRYYAQCFDLVLTNNPLCERFHLYGIDALFLPNVHSAEVFRPTPGMPKEIDVSFIGAMSGKVGRASHAQALSRSGLDLKLFGPGTKAGVLTPSEVIDVYRRSRINLNFTGANFSTPLDSHLSINRRVRQVKGRCNKIAMCGSFVLSEYAPGIERLFDVGREIDVFHDSGELVDKIRFYLSRDQLREEMAARARSRALAQYDEAKFWPGMIGEIRARVAAKRRRRLILPLCVDQSFLSAFGAWRFKYLVIFAFTGKLRLFFGEMLLLLRTRRLAWPAAVAFAGAGLYSARTRSRPAAWAATIVVRLRRLLKAKQ